jgi:hypothetical protein
MMRASWVGVSAALLLLGGGVAAGEPGGHREHHVVVDGQEIDLTDPLAGVHQRGFLGVELIEITPDLRRHFGAPEDAGVLVGTVEAASPAASSGVKVGDVIVSLDGRPIRAAHDLRAVVRVKKDGETVRLEMWRDHKKVTVEARVARGEVEEVDVSPLLFKDGHFAQEVERAMRRAREQLRSVQADVPAIERDVERHMKDLDQRLKDLERRLDRAHN